MVTYYVSCDKEYGYPKPVTASDIAHLRAKLMKKGKDTYYVNARKDGGFMGYLYYTVPNEAYYIYTHGWIWDNETNKSYVAKNGRLEYNKDIHYPQYKR